MAVVTHGETRSFELIDAVLSMDHDTWETILYVGSEEFRQTEGGPYPNHQLRISVNPRRGYAAINFQDHDDPALPNANSFNPEPTPADLFLVFSGNTGAVFPSSAAIEVEQARAALRQFVVTRKRPTNIQWRPYGSR
ncbi:Imm1 family immunity protein [Lentzea sp. JNUCC 0626]|uniref:Imm1 family immunity protein n=1 Tax=Lentzea sp. JNUCC 0626 TaxID=3367513 RepID=UPI0037483C6E